jgi:hypothetical protein
LSQGKKKTNKQKPGKSTKISDAAEFNHDSDIVAIET